MLLCYARRSRSLAPLASLWSASPSSGQPPFPTMLLVSFGLLFTCWSFMLSYVASMLPLALMCCVGRNAKNKKDHHLPPMAWSLTLSSEQPPFPYHAFGVVWFVVCLLVFHALLCYVHAPLRIVVLRMEEWWGVVKNTTPSTIAMVFIFVLLRWATAPSPYFVVVVLFGLLVGLLCLVMVRSYSPSCYYAPPRIFVLHSEEWQGT